MTTAPAAGGGSGRRARWWRAALAVLALGVIAALGAGWGLRACGAHRLADARRRFEREVGPLYPAHYPPPPLAARDNAMVSFRAAARRLAGRPEEWTRVRDLLRQPPYHWSAADRAPLDALLAANHEALLLAFRTKDQPRSSLGLDYGTAGSEPAGQDLVPLVKLARLLQAKVAAELTAVPPEDAVFTALRLSALAEALRREPPLIAQLLGAAVESKYLRTLAWILQRRGWSPQDLARLAATLGPADPAAAFAHEFAVEGPRLIRQLQQVSPADRGWRRESFRLFTADRWAAAALDGMREFALRTRQPAPEVESFYQKQWASSPDPTGSPEAGAEVMLRLLLPNCFSALERLQAVEASRDLARAALAWRHSPGEQGTCPADPAHFPGLRPDPLTRSWPLCSRGARGEITLSNPRAEAQARTVWTQDPAAMPPFAWQLPAVTPPVPGVPAR